MAKITDPYDGMEIRYVDPVPIEYLSDGRPSILDLYMYIHVTETVGFDGAINGPWSYWTDVRDDDDVWTGERVAWTVWDEHRKSKYIGKVMG